MSTVPTNAGYVFDDDELPALAAMNGQLTSALAVANDQNRNLQGMLQQSRDVLANMQANMVSLQEQIDQLRRAPVLMPMLESAGVFERLPVHAATSSNFARSVGRDGSVREEASLSFDPTARDRLRVENARIAAQHEQRTAELETIRRMHDRMHRSLKGKIFGDD